MIVQSVDFFKLKSSVHSEPLTDAPEGNDKELKETIRTS